MEERDIESDEDFNDIQDSEAEKKFDVNIDELQRRNIDKKRIKKNRPIEEKSCYRIRF